MDPARSMGSLGAIPLTTDNLAALAGPAVVLAVAYWYIKVHGFIYAASLLWTVVGVVKTIFAIPFNMVYWVVSSVLMIPYYLLMVVLSPLTWLWHAFMAPFHWFLRFLGDPYVSLSIYISPFSLTCSYTTIKRPAYLFTSVTKIQPVVVFFTIAIVLGLCSGLIMSLFSAIASSFIHSFASSSIPHYPRKQQASATVKPTNVNTTTMAATNNKNNNNNNNTRDSRPSRGPPGFLNPLALHPTTTTSSSQSGSGTGTGRFNPYDADSELIHIEYPNLSDTGTGGGNTPSPTLKTRNSIPASSSSYFDQQQQQQQSQQSQQRSPKSMSPHGPPQLHARPRSAVSVKRGLGLSAIGGGGTPGSVVGGSTLLRETIHEEEDSGFSDDSV